MNAGDDNSIVTEREGRIARIRLSRPSALHALTQPMCEAILEALAAFGQDDTIESVIFDHAEGRGFCAGGDIRMLAASGSGDGAQARAFFRAEYRMNHALFSYRKPTIAFMDGITMGGGVGIALPCHYRVATENTRFAMPETGIGLFPDVGGGWYLPRLEGQVGKFLALTGARLDGSECVSLGLATHYLPAEALDEAKARIADDPSRTEGILGQLSATPPLARIEDSLLQINRLFAGETLEAILAALEADPGEWAAKELATLRSKSPLSCKVALRQLREGAAMPDFASEMAREYAIGARMVHTHDFIEGVRALIVDKDNLPVWNPAIPEGVSDATVDAIFAPLAEPWSPQ